MVQLVLETIETLIGTYIVIVSLSHCDGIILFTYVHVYIFTSVHVLCVSGAEQSSSLAGLCPLCCLSHHQGQDGERRGVFR